MTNFNLSTILKLTNDAFDLDGLTDFCFLHFRPVYDQFRETDRKSVRVRMLIDHTERKGQLAELLALIQAENPGKYAQYTNQLRAASPASLTISQPPGAQGPLQRPRRAEHFTGREAELAWVLTELQPGKVITPHVAGDVSRQSRLALVQAAVI